MGILKRLQERFAEARSLLREGELTGVAADRVGLSAEIPGTAGTPLWKLDVQVLTEPHGDGEKVRLRAHIQTNFGSALKPALEDRPDPRAIESDARALTRAQKVGQLAQRAAARVMRTP